MSQYLYIWKLTPANHAYQVNPFILDHPMTSLDESSLALPGGAYTTFRTYYRTRVLRLREHILRLKESATRVQYPIEILESSLRRVLRRLLEKCPFQESRVRITLDLQIEPGSIYLAFEELHLISPDAYLKGVKVNTRIMHRDNPKAKLTQFIATAADYRSQLPAGIHETLMVQEDGAILEGLSSNFFGVFRNAIWTAEEGILSGITRAIVLDIAHQDSIPVKFTPVRIDELTSLQESFITSASRAVLPVVQVDQKQIGDGAPGPITKLLIQRFEDWIQREVEEI